MEYEMSVKKDLICGFNMPQELSSKFDREEELVHSLPPYAKINAYPVDEYPGCPENWMHGSDIASSYFVGIKEKHGMWLDFNRCGYHTHNVAIVISIQGINPITGQKMVAKKALRLEQYHKQCPIHKIDFKQDRYCEKCGFKWPGQNYLCTTGTPRGLLWLDGFRSPDGKIRQYIFTAEKMRGVAAQLIGEERVFAIGIAYYLSKDKKPEPPKTPDRSTGFAGSPAWLKGPYKTKKSFGPCGQSVGGSLGSDYDASMTAYCAGGEAMNYSPPILCDTGDERGVNIASLGSTKSAAHIRQAKVQSVTPVKNLEIGAGAVISQRVYDDPKEIDYWEPKPAGMIYINYCDAETHAKILAAGKRADKKDGFMEGLQVGSET